MNPMCPKYISNKRVFSKNQCSNFLVFTVVTLYLQEKVLNINNRQLVRN